MNPEARFPVGNRTIDEISSLVSNQGITLEPLTRFKTEKYPGSENKFPAEEDWVDINGGLTFNGEMFPFTLQIINGTRGTLCVNMSDGSLKTANALVEALEAIFPSQTCRSSQVVSASTRVIWNKIPLGFLIFS